MFVRCKGRSWGEGGQSLIERCICEASGPVQYRLRKSGSGLEKRQGQTPLNTEERAVARLLMQFPDVVAEAATNFAPSSLCSYLNKLAQAFNLFYAKHEILGNDSRLALTAATAQTTKNGLYLLGIEMLEQM